MGGWGAKKQTKLTIAQKRNEKRKTSILKEVDTHALQLCAHDALSFWLSTARCRVHGPWTGPDRTGFLELRSGPVRSNTLRCSVRSGPDHAFGVPVRSGPVQLRLETRSMDLTGPNRALY